MKKLIPVIVSLWVWLVAIPVCFLYAFVATLIWLITILFDKRLVVLHTATTLIAALFIVINPYWSIHVEGRKKIKRHGVYVIVSNHQSLVDILVLFLLFRHFKWVSKVENFRIPAIGWVMTLNRYIRVDRLRGRSYLKMISDCEKALTGGSSVLIFPEGTRSTDGKMHGFKEGAFRVAINAGVPILPVLIDGTHAALPKHGIILQTRQKIRVRVLDAIPAEAWGTNDPAELTNKIHSFMEKEFNMMAGGC